MKDRYAFIFDLDGTIADTNKFHEDTWYQTLKKYGYEVDYEKIKYEIGKGGDNFLKDVIGDVDKSKEKEINEYKSQLYNKKVEEEQVRLFPSSMEVMNRLHHLGFYTVVATSGSGNDFEKINQLTDRKLTEHIDVVVTSDDVETTKPAPDLISVAIEKIGTSNNNCAMVGDTTHDITSAKKIGVKTIGLMSGFHSFEMLKEAGAIHVYKNIEDFYNHLDLVINDFFPEK